MSPQRSPLPASSQEDFSSPSLDTVSSWVHGILAVATSPPIPSTEATGQGHTSRPSFPKKPFPLSTVGPRPHLEGVPSFKTEPQEKRPSRQASGPAKRLKEANYWGAGSGEWGCPPMHPPPSCWHLWYKHQDKCACLGQEMPGEA